MADDGFAQLFAGLLDGSVPMSPAVRAALQGSPMVAEAGAVDPFTLAAGQVRGAVQPAGGRQEGGLTRAAETAVPNTAVHMAHIPQRAIEAAGADVGGYGYDPGPILDAAMLPMGLSAPFAERGVLGAMGGRINGYKAMDTGAPALNAETGMTHVALDRAVAEQFSKGGTRGVHEVAVNTKKPFDYRDPEDLAWLMKEMEKPKNIAAYNRDTKKMMGPHYDHVADARYIQGGLEEGAYQTYEVPAVSDLIKGRGYDGIYMIEDFQRGQPNLAVFDPAQIEVLGGGKVGALAGSKKRGK